MVDLSPGLRCFVQRGDNLLAPIRLVRVTSLVKFVSQFVVGSIWFFCFTSLWAKRMLDFESEHKNISHLVNSFRFLVKSHKAFVLRWLCCCALNQKKERAKMVISLLKNLVWNICSVQIQDTVLSVLSPLTPPACGYMNWMDQPPTKWIINVMPICYYFVHIQEKTIPKAVMDVIDEEMNKLNFLDNHSSEFR